MQNILNTLTQFMSPPLSIWHWWTFAVLCIGMEMIVPASVFLWPALAAVCVGILVFLFPALGFYGQVLLFGVLTASSAIFLRKWLKRHPLKTDKPTLNKRGAALIGRQATLKNDLTEDGMGDVWIDGTKWRIQTSNKAPLKQEAVVEVIHAKGMLLEVTPVKKAV